MAGIHQSAEQQRYQEEVAQGLHERYHNAHGANLLECGPDWSLEEEKNPAKENNSLKLRADTTIVVQCHKYGFIRLNTTPYTIKKGVEEFYVAANAYCPVCGEEQGKKVGDGLSRWYIPTNSPLP